MKHLYTITIFLLSTCTAIGQTQSGGSPPPPQEDTTEEDTTTARRPKPIDRRALNMSFLYNYDLDIDNDESSSNSYQLRYNASRSGINLKYDDEGRSNNLAAPALRIDFRRSAYSGRFWVLSFDGKLSPPDWIHFKKCSSGKIKTYNPSNPNGETRRVGEFVDGRFVRTIKAVPRRYTSSETFRFTYDENTTGSARTVFIQAISYHTQRRVAHTARIAIRQTPYKIKMSFCYGRADVTGTESSGSYDISHQASDININTDCSSGVAAAPALEITFSKITSTDYWTLTFNGSLSPPDWIHFKKEVSGEIKTYNPSGKKIQDPDSVLPRTKTVPIEYDSDKTFRFTYDANGNGLDITGDRATVIQAIHYSDNGEGLIKAVFSKSITIRQLASRSEQVEAPDPPETNEPEADAEEEDAVEDDDDEAPVVVPPAVPQVHMSPNPIRAGAILSIGAKQNFDFVMSTTSQTIVFAGKIQTGQNQITIPIVPAGEYILTFRNAKHQEIKRLIIE